MRPQVLFCADMEAAVGERVFPFLVNSSRVA